jgi:hypothetical protein
MRSEDEIQLERDAKEKARQHNPAVVPIVKVGLITDDIFGMVRLGRLLKKMKDKFRRKPLALAFLAGAFLITGCATPPPPPTPAAEAGKAMIYGAVYEIVADEIKKANQ